jgi:hypothetical protein
MLSCYLDEAGGDDTGFTVVCGWISTVACWERFEIDWKLFLASFNVPYFHMKEFSHSTGPFKKWKNCEGIRAHFLRDAAEIILSHVQGGILVNVHHGIFKDANRRIMLKETLSSPYALAGRACVAQVDKHTGYKDVEYVFEDGGPDKGGLQAAMGKEFRLPDPIFKPSRDIKDKRGNLRNGLVQLQAADFLAYEIRKNRVEVENKTGHPTRESLRSILRLEDMQKDSFRGTNASSLCQLEKYIQVRK